MLFYNADCPPFFGLVYWQAVDKFGLFIVQQCSCAVLILWLVYWQAIDNLDADVLTIENSRSGNEMIVALAKYGYKKDVGPGVYDVHSPVVPR